jgi:hypothetical protein
VSGRSLSLEEKAAGEIVARQLGGRAVERDGERGSHDFDVEVSGGRTVTLEVTSAADEAIESLHRAAFRRAHAAPELASDWWLGLPNDGSVQVKRAVRSALPHLAVLEAEGVESIGGVALSGRRAPDGASDAVVEAVRQLYGLRVSFARRLRAPADVDGAEVLLSLHGGAGSNFDQLNELVAECARRKGPQLAGAGGSERHLFIWMRNSVSDAELAMATLPPPPIAPELHEAVDVVWVATLPSTPGALYGKLWRLRPPGGWEQIDGVG